MNQTNLLQFESKLEHGSQLKNLWEEFIPCINDGKVESREKAYILFSIALKISQLAKKQESLNELWLNLLSQGNFSLCQDLCEPINYRFTTISELVKSGRDTFEFEIEEVNSTNANLSNIAEAIHSIALSSFGKSPGASFFKTIITLPNTMCLLAREKETFIACAYGTYLEMPQINFFHLNFLGRKVEYPCVHIIKKLQGEVARIQTKFPDVQYLTLCVNAKNDHMMPIYKELGFEEIEYIKAGFKDEPTYFYAKKIAQNSGAKPPSYLEYKTAIEAQRKNYS
ncbi:MAG: hypothetical protein H0W50_08900 [Parachlamydiaceae bacterium]|nr:hypothetical protein [Parachlamydiaceae bacterium]